MDISALSAASTSFINTLTRRPLYTVIGTLILSLVASIGLLFYVGLLIRLACLRLLKQLSLS
jgi:hypothetical protein